MRKKDLSTASLIILFSRSFLISAEYRTKNNGPKTLPWGTPQTTDLNWLKFLSTETRCGRLVKISFKILKIGPPTTVHFNLYNRLWWLTELKTELKLSETFRDSGRFSRKDCRSCISNRRPFLKLNWVMGKIFIESINL